MSLITDDPEHSPRDCSRARDLVTVTKHHHHHRRRRRRRVLVAASSTVASLVSLALILWWLTFRPSSPRFSLLAATVTLAADDSAPATITVAAALTTHNPNAHATALYDQLRASASYAGVPLGAGAPLPPLEQPDQGDAVLSALLTSPSPSPWKSGAGGRALLSLRIEGQLRWRVAAWVSGRRGITVDCIAAVMLMPSSSAGRQQQGSSSSSPSPQCASQVQ